MCQISAFLNGVGFFEGIGAFDLIMPTRQDQRMFSRDLILRMHSIPLPPS